MPEPASSEPKKFDEVLGRVASGIYILTVGSGERATGMLASWVTQVGFEPPMVCVAVKQGRYVSDWITEGQPFILNVVGESQKSMLGHFGRGFDIGAPAFEGLKTSFCPRGATILDDLVGHLQCEPVRHIDSGDHRLFLANVVRGALHTDEQPMVHIRKSGANY